MAGIDQDELQTGERWPLPREETITLRLLQATVPVMALEPTLLASDYDRLPSLREFIKVSRQLIAELGYGDDV